jgi:PKD repeat protein
LKGKKENMNIRELFRHKLENSEVIPSDSVGSDLMRNLGIREFFRFNPSRFNVYYLGGIIAFCVATAVLLAPHPVSFKKHETISPSQEKIRVDTLSDDSTGRRQTEKRMQILQSDTLRNKGVRSGTDKNAVVEFKAPVNKTVEKTNNVLTKGNQDYLQNQSLIRDTLSESRKKNLLMEKAIAAFDVSSKEGCPPLTVRFRNNSTSFDSCRWIFGDGGSSTRRDPEWIFDVEGEYKVILKVFGSRGDEASATSILEIHPRPVARFEISPAKPIIPDDEIRFHNYSTDAVRYRWEFGDGDVSESFEPYHKYRKYGNYDVRLIAWSEKDCSDSMRIVNAFSGSGCYIDFPNAFIPNPDGPAGGYYSSKSDEAAQIFHPVTSGVSDFQLRIFSKKGILIFESNDIYIGWDGYLKGQLCDPGVYIWKVRGTYKNGEPFVKMGDVTLLKK